MPENDDEIIIKINETFIDKSRIDEVLNNVFYIENPSEMQSEKTDLGEVKVVGVKFYKGPNYEIKFYVKDKVFENLRTMINKNYSEEKVLFNDKYEKFQIIETNKVSSGKVLVNDDLKYEFKDNNIIGQKLQILVHNLYYEDSLNLEVSDTFNKNNIKNKTGYSNFEKYQYYIFVNKDDYDSLYNKQTYQSSVFVKDVEKIDDTINQLKAIGIKPRKVSDYKIDNASQSKRILKIVRTIVTILLIIVLYFLSYIIIKIILKSRNAYFTTLRMLGSNKKDLKKILDVELILDSNIAYFVILLVINLLKENLIKVTWLNNLSAFLNVKEFIIMYVIIFVTTRMISRMYSKKIFKDTIIRTYDEEV